MVESGKMITPYIFKRILIVAILVFAMVRTSNLNFILAGVQGIFSASIIEDSIALVLYHKEMVSLYESQYDFFIMKNEQLGINSAEEAILIRNIVRYEVVKAYYKVQLDSKIYKKYRDSMNDNWTKIEKAINNSVEQGRESNV